jgi:hypothetical protein
VRRFEARGWPHRTTPVVLVPAPVRDTANPPVRAKFPPLVIGSTTGTLVARLKASGEGSRLTARSRHASSKRFASQGPAIKPRAFFFVARRFGVALGDKPVQCIAGPLLRRHYQTPALDSDADPGSRPWRRMSSNAGGTAGMTEPPTFQLVVCMSISSSYI